MKQQRKQSQLTWRISSPPEQEDYIGHRFDIWGLAVTPNERFILTFSGDRTVKIWDVQTGKLLNSTMVSSPYDKLRCLTVTPDSQYAIVGYDGFGETLCTLDLKNDLRMRPFRDSSRLSAHIIAVTPDSQYVIVGNDFKTFEIRIYDLQTQELVYNLAGHGIGNWVAKIFVTPNGRHVVSISKDIKVWDLQNGQEIQTFYDKNISGVKAITPDGQHILCSTQDNAIGVWSLETGQQIGIPVCFHPDRIINLEIMPDSSYVISSSKDNKIRVWDWTNKTLRHVLAGHSSISDIAIAPNRYEVISGGILEGTIKIWNIRTGELRCSSLSAETNISFIVTSPDEKYFVAHYGYDTSALGVWKLTGEWIYTLKGHTGRINAAEFTEDNRFLISASEDNMLKLWELQTGQLVQTLIGHLSSIKLIKVIKGTDEILSFSEDLVVKRWSLTTGQELDSQKILTLPISFRCQDVVLSPDGHYIITPSLTDKNKQVIWNVKTSERWLLPEEIKSAFITHDNRFAVFGTDKKIIKIWDLDKAEMIQTVKVPRKDLCYTNTKTKSLSKSGYYVMSKLPGYCTMVWDLWSGKMVCICEGAGSNDFFVTANNRYLVSNSAYVVKVWNLETGVEVYASKVSTRERGRITSLCVTSDNCVVIGSKNGQLYCLHLPETF